MARASAWGLGAALAYRGMDIEEQVELLALYMASRVKDGEEGKDLIQCAILEPVVEYMRRRAGITEPPPPGPGALSGQGVTGGRIPDILKPRLTPDSLASR